MSTRRNRYPNSLLYKTNLNFKNLLPQIFSPFLVLFYTHSLAEVIQTHVFKYVFAARLCLVTQLCPTLPLHGGQHTGVGSPSLLQGIFPTQELNPSLPHCGRILYQLRHKGSLRILEWVAFPFSRISSQPRNWTQVSHNAGRFFTSWATYTDNIL